MVSKVMLMGRRPVPLSTWFALTLVLVVVAPTLGHKIEIMEQVLLFVLSLSAMQLDPVSYVAEKIMLSLTAGTDITKPSTHMLPIHRQHS